MDLTPHWDNLSMLVYITMGIFGALCIRSVNRRSGAEKCRIISKTGFFYIAWFAVWIVFAVFRYVGSWIGGGDASSYIRYFEVCQNPGAYSFAQHVDVLYRLLNLLIRQFTNDYHVLFFVIYGIIVLSYIKFVEEFRFSRMSYIPLILIVYIYIRGFTSIRTNLGAACILFSIVFLHKKRTIVSIVFAVISGFFQVASFIYAFFILFYVIFKKRRLSIRSCIIWIVIASVVGKIGQYIIANYEIPLLSHGAYKWYATNKLSGTSFFSNFWKIAFSQMLLGVVLAVLWKLLDKDVDSRTKEDGEKIEFIKMICIYDIILIPVTYILGIWRGYEYLYIARLMLWSALIPVVAKKLNERSKKVFYAGVLVAFIGWMIFRQYNTWEDSGLMPYVFEPFL